MHFRVVAHCIGAFDKDNRASVHDGLLFPSMKRSEIRQFIKEGVNSLTPVLDYSEGQITDWNAQRSNQYPGIVLVLEETDTDIPTTSTPSNDKWDIKIIIANKDALDSTPDVYEAIVDSCDEIAQRLIYKYRNVIDGYKLTTMESITRKKFIKKYADCLSGVELSFKINNQDQTNVC